MASYGRHVQICRQNADLDSVDCHADLEVLANEVQLWLFRDLWAWLNNPLEGPPAARQLAEQLPMPLVW
jgi:hypothetical protein